MKVSVEDREGLVKALNVKVEGSLVQDILNEVYDEFKQNVEIKGFRKGMAPLWLIKNKFKEEIKEEVGKKVANKTLKEAIEESKLTPVADIYLEKVELEDKVPEVSYVVIFEVPPEFELKEVEGLEVEVPKIEFKEEMVEERIKALQEEHAVWEPVEDREVKEGDMVVIHYEVEESEGGEVVDGETSGVVGTNIFRPEIDEKLAGRKVGDTLEVKDLPLYDEKGNEVGKANVKIEIKEIKEKVLPEPGDDFAKELGYENWEEALEKIREEIKNDIETIKQNAIEDAVSDKLVSIHEIEAPKTLVSRELSFLVDKRVKEIEALGIDKRYIDYRKLVENLKPQAEANVKVRFILDKYAEVHNIEATDEDVEKELELLAKQSNATKEEVKNYFEKENMMDVVREDARRKKALQDVISKVSIKEVDVESNENEEE